MEKLASILICFYLSLVSVSCGVYGFRGNNPPAGINSINIPTFQDNSGFSSPTLAETFTQRLKDRLIGDNTFRVADRNIADGLLNCVITNVKDEALIISSGENVSRRKVTISVNVVFEDLKRQKKLWEKNFDNYGEYNSSSNTFSERQIGIEVAIERITEDIVIDLTSNW